MNLKDQIRRLVADWYGSDEGERSERREQLVRDLAALLTPADTKTGEGEGDVAGAAK